MANLQGFTATAQGLTVVLDDGTSQDFNFPSVTPTPTGPTEEAVKAAVDAAVTSAFSA